MATGKDQKGKTWKWKRKQGYSAHPSFLKEIVVEGIYIPRTPMSLVLIGKDHLLEAKHRTNGFQVYICIFIYTQCHGFKYVFGRNHHLFEKSNMPRFSHAAHTPNDSRSTLQGKKHIPPGEKKHHL